MFVFLPLLENVMNKIDQARQDLRTSEKKRREVKNFVSLYSLFISHSVCLLTLSSYTKSSLQNCKRFDESYHFGRI